MRGIHFHFISLLVAWICAADMLWPVSASNAIRRIVASKLSFVYVSRSRESAVMSQSGGGCGWLEIYVMRGQDGGIGR